MQDLFNGVYKNKRVLVTGHTGFKGSWLTLWLTLLGAEVIGYSLEPNTEPNLFNLLKLEDKITHIIGDIRDCDKVAEVFQKYQPEIVFHLAAQPLVRYSYKEPRYTYETNVMGTINVFEAVRQTKSVKAAVNVTSDKCYENKEWVYGYRETDPMGGYDPYSSSKGVSELVTSSYRNSFFNPNDFGKTHNIALASGRAGNVIGGGDWSEDRLVPDIVKALSENQEINIRSPYATRPWQLVLEPLSGYLLLGKLLLENGAKHAEGWNFGPYDESVLTVDDVVKRAIKIWGSGKYTTNQSSELHEANLLKLDISKAIQKLGWKPAYNVEQAISETINWYKAFYNNENMVDFSISQLNNYVKNINY